MLTRATFYLVEELIQFKGIKTHLPHRRNLLGMTNTFIILSVVIVHEFLHLPKPIKLCTLSRDGLICVNNRSIKLLKKPHWVPNISLSST